MHASAQALMRAHSYAHAQTHTRRHARACTHTHARTHKRARARARTHTHTHTLTRRYSLIMPLVTCAVLQVLLAAPYAFNEKASGPTMRTVRRCNTPCWGCNMLHHMGCVATRLGCIETHLGCVATRLGCVANVRCWAARCLAMCFRRYVGCSSGSQSTLLSARAS